MTPITNEALHGLFLFMPSELPVCYSYLAGKQHQLAHPKCCVLCILKPCIVAGGSRVNISKWVVVFSLSCNAKILNK